MEEANEIASNTGGGEEHAGYREGIPFESFGTMEEARELLVVTSNTGGGGGGVILILRVRGVRPMDEANETSWWYPMALNTGEGGDLENRKGGDCAGYRGGGGRAE